MIEATFTLPESLRKAVAGLGKLAADAMPAVALATSEKMRENFLRLQQQPNRLGGDRTNFWLEAADATTATVNGLEVLLNTAKRGVRLHLKGGTVRPKNVSEITREPIKFLTIPRVAEAHGKTAATLIAMGVMLYPGPGGLYRQTGETRNPAAPWSSWKPGRKNKSSDFNAGSDPLYFVFARQVTIKANPATLPTAQDFADAAGQAVEDHIAATLWTA